MHRYRLLVCDLSGKERCTLYDSEFSQDGEARDIEFVSERTGWKEIHLTLPYYLRNGEHNFRVDYLLNEYRLQYWKDDDYDVFCIKEDTHIRDAKRLDLTVQGNHISEELKTKNLYLVFDDENGIDTCNNLLNKALVGTGWTLGSCPIFYETNSSVVKRRSFTCDTKTGAYAMVTGICELFRARAVFNGKTKTIDIYKNSTAMGPLLEMNYGRNVDKLTRKLDTSKLITRLYVEGEYGDFGYVGIDDASANTNKTPFILNFDYYKQIGLFTTAHETAVNTYISKYKLYTGRIKTNMAQMLERQKDLAKQIGTCDYIYAPVVNSEIQLSDIIRKPGMPDTATFLEGDNVAVVEGRMDAYDGDYQYTSYSLEDMELEGAKAVILFDPTITGLLGSCEDMMVVKEEDAVSIHEKFTQFMRNAGFIETDQEAPDISTLMSIYGVSNIIELANVADSAYEASSTYETLEDKYKNQTTRQFAAELAQNSIDYDNFHVLKASKMDIVIFYIERINTLYNAILSDQALLDAAERTFANAMGPLLRDGYWADNNYTVGQEDSLYADALEVSEKMAWPIISYSFDARPIYEIEGFEDEDWQISQRLHIYDKVLGIDDYVYTDKIREHADAPMKNGMDATTDLLELGQKSFSTTIERISGLAENLFNNKDIYARADSFSRDGTLSSDFLEGTIDTLTNKMLSTSSNWGTDDKGNLIFTSLDGNSAMMLCGSGFMVANGKNPDGTWRWRTFGSGEGFTADMIVAGFISTERLQAGSITTSLLASGVGDELNIESNNAIRMVVSKAEADDAVLEAGLTDTINQRIESSITMLQNQIDLRVTQGELSSYLRATIDGVYIGRTDSNFESVVRAEGFDILYYKNGKDETAANYTPPTVVWEATAYGMHATQMMLDIDYGGDKDTIVKQSGTTTGGMVWL